MGGKVHRRINSSMDRVSTGPCRIILSLRYMYEGATPKALVRLWSRRFHNSTRNSKKVCPQYSTTYIFYKVADKTKQRYVGRSIHRWGTPPLKPIRYFRNLKGFLEERHTMVLYFNIFVDFSANATSQASARRRWGDNIFVHILY